MSILFAIATVAAVALYIQQGKLEDEAKAAKDAKTKADGERAKAAAELSQVIKELAQTGSDPKDTLTKINAKLAEMPRDLTKLKPGQPVDASETYKGMAVVEALTKLAETRLDFYNKAAKLDQEIVDLKGQIATLSALKDEQPKKVEQVQNDEASKRAELTKHYKDEMAKLVTELGAAKAEKAAAIKDLDKAREDAVVASTNWQNEKTKLEGKLDEFRKILKAVNPDEADKATWSTAKLADGKVLQVSPDRQSVYLQLDRPEQAKLSMRYVIHSKGKAIPNSGKGKAVVEISSLEGGAVQARIVQSESSDPIVPDDLALNVVVGPRKLNFVVFGDFDLNGDGSLETNGKAQIEALITRWGGTVQQDMSIDTSFVVLGEQPPEPARPAAGDALADAAYKSKMAAKAKWTELRTKAEQQTIPYMNTTTFLHYIGYYNTGSKERPGEDYLH